MGEIILETPVAGITQRGLKLFLARAQRAVRLRGEVNVLLASSARLRRLNRDFRAKDAVTDVLSFPASAGNGIAGDIAISAPLARRQARSLSHSPAQEVKLLLLHGLLHLAGYDHERDQGQMARRELRLRRRLNLPVGLIERSRTSPHPPHDSRRRAARPRSTS